MNTKKTGAYIFYLDGKTAQRIENMAKKKGISKSKCVRVAIKAMESKNERTA